MPEKHHIPLTSRVATFNPFKMRLEPMKRAELPKATEPYLPHIRKGAEDIAKPVQSSCVPSHLEQLQKKPMIDLNAPVDAALFAYCWNSMVERHKTPDWQRVALERAGVTLQRKMHDGETSSAADIYRALYKRFGCDDRVKPHQVEHFIGLADRAMDDYFSIALKITPVQAKQARESIGAGPRDI